jgi:trypsin
MTRTALLVLIVTGVLAGLVPAHAGAIVGGDVAAPGRWPSLVAIVDSGSANANYGQECGGTVIAPRRVLTAAHCVIGTPTPELSVIAGRTRLSDIGGRVIRVTAVSVFPGYLTSAQFLLDAAVLTLADDAGVPAIRLATAADAAAWAPGTLAWTAGWGEIDAHDSPGGFTYTADRLRELQTPIVGDDACERVYGGTVYSPAARVCAGVPGSGQGTCYGDSGGPLVVGQPGAWLQVGIVQGGDNCGDEQGFYDLYTRVDRIAAFAARPNLVEQPYALGSPRIRGHLKDGAHLRCVSGTWAGSPAELLFVWTRLGSDGTAVVGTGATHRVSHRDVLDGVTCGVQAINRGGYGTAEASRGPA